MRKLIYILFLFLISCKPGLKNESDKNLCISISLQENKNNDIYIDIKKALVENGSKPTDIQFLKPFFNYCSNKFSKSDSLHFLDQNIILLITAIKNTPEFEPKDTTIFNLNSILNAYKSKELSFELCYNHFLLIEKQYFDFLSSYVSYTFCGIRYFNISKSDSVNYLNKPFTVAIRLNFNRKDFRINDVRIAISDLKGNDNALKFEYKIINNILFIKVFPTTKGVFELGGVCSVKLWRNINYLNFSHSFKVI